MPDTTPNAKGPAPVQLTPEATEPALIPADQVKPEDIGKLSIEYRDGKPVIVVSGGTYSPAALAVVDGSGKPVARYAAATYPDSGQGLIALNTFDQFNSHYIYIDYDHLMDLQKGKAAKLD
ncbi:hypothetical protein ACFYZH_23955 [Streptomyces abikoensis]|uniref:hypothetical protein n=1 Tax=Streptomyces abikoensis TaxID=97398 RepID=UPI00368C7E1E